MSSQEQPHSDSDEFSSSSESYAEASYSGNDDTFMAIQKAMDDALPRELGLSSGPLLSADSLTNMTYKIRRLNQNKIEDKEEKDALVEDSIHRKSKRRKTGVRGRPKAVDYGFGKSTTHKLSPEASSLMGKGNMAYVKKDYSTAIGYFLEVIKLSPKSPEPYRTLATAYLEISDFPKAFGYVMVAAHMSSNDEKLWQEVATLALQLDKKLEAVYCLEMVIRSSGPLVSLETNDKLASLLLSLNQPLKAIKSYTKYLTTPLRDESHVIDDTVFQKIAQFAVDFELIEECCIYFEKLIAKFLQGFPIDTVWSPINLFLELLLQSENYSKLLESVEAYSHKQSSVVFSGDLLTESPRSTFDSMPEEIYTKYAVSLIMTNQKSKVDYERLSNLDPAVYGDLRSTAASAYYERRFYSKALNLLLPLQDAIIDMELKVKLGYCQKNLKDLYSAAETFNSILIEDPSREDARIALADVYQQMGRRQEALRLMETGHIIRQRQVSSSSGLADASALDEEFAAENSSEDEDIYNQDGAIISFYRHKRKEGRKKRRRVRAEAYSSEECARSVNLYNRFSFLMSNDSSATLSSQLQADLIQTAGSIWKTAIDNALLFPKDSKIKLVDDASVLCGLSCEEWMNFFLKHIIMLEQLERSDLALRAARATLKSNPGKQEPLYSKVKMAILAIHLKEKNLQEAADCFRFIWTDERDDLVPLFYSVLCPNPSDGAKALSGVNFFRSVHRCAAKKASFLNLKCLLGHLYALSGSFEEAARSYRLASQIAATAEEKAAVDLFMYNALSQRTMQRTCHNPREYLVKAFAYLLRYLKTVEAEIPGRQAEAYYNVGRAYHGLGMLGAAQVYYKKSVERDGGYYPARYNSSLICKLY